MRGDLIAAQNEVEQARQRLTAQNLVWDWKFRILEANLYVLQGHSDRVLSTLSENLPASLASTDLGIQQWMLRALAYSRLGMMAQASDAINRAQLLCDRQHSQLAGDLFRTRGTVDVEQNNLDDAEKMFHKSLEFARLKNDRFLQATALLNLGVVAEQREHFDESLDWSRSAADVARTIGARVIQERAQGNVAWADYQLGNYEEALIRVKEADREARELGSLYDSVEWLNTAGLSLYQMGHREEAETYYKNSLQLAETIRNQEEIIGAHITLASLYLQLGKLDDAALHDDQALSLATAGGRKFDEMDALFLKSLITIKRDKPDPAEKILTRLEVNPKINPSLHWQVEGALADLNLRENRPAAANKWYRQSITTFETQRQTIKEEDSKLPFSTNANQLYDDYVYFLIHHKKTDEALQWLDRGRARTLEEGLGVASANFDAMLRHPLNTTAIAHRLHGTILVYSLAPKESYLWAITASGTHFFKLPGSAEIDQHVKNYQRAILSSKDTLANAYADGLNLYTILVEPAQSLIPKDSPVFIIPDGSLQTLNFETLLAPGGGLHYWIEDTIITDASSLKLLDAFRPEQDAKPGKKLLLIGNPISPAEMFPDLPNASSEVASVAEHFPAAEETVFTQSHALPSMYAASSPGQFSYIHFVAHGTSSSASPLDSAIVLTRNPANPDAFKLYARDIMRYPLHAKLVTISACYGSGSRIYGGEGLIGLSWAFLRAGSHYVVGSLWEVSDAATPQLMNQMYSELAGGGTPDTALRDAKLLLLHSQGVYRKPLYWGTFQLYGGA